MTVDLNRFKLFVGLGLVLPWLVGGCQNQEQHHRTERVISQIIDPLSIMELQPPVRIGVTDFDFSPLSPLFRKRALLQQDMSDYLNEPVVFSLMTPHQIAVHLGTGRLMLAMVSTDAYAQIADYDNHEIIAVAQDRHGRCQRRGLLIVKADSAIESLDQIRSRRFHFLAEGDLLNQAALGALLEAGISLEELDRGILGLGLDTHHLNSLEVAKSVVLEKDAVGVIDEYDYNRWPETGGNFLLLSPAKDQIRIIGRTVSVPHAPVLVSKEAPPELVRRIRYYLLKIAPDKPLVMTGLGHPGFLDGCDVQAYRPFLDVVRQLHPMPTDQSAPSESTQEREDELSGQTSEGEGAS